MPLASFYFFVASGSTNDVQIWKPGTSDVANRLIDILAARVVWAPDANWIGGTDGSSVIFLSAAQESSGVSTYLDNPCTIASFPVVAHAGTEALVAHPTQDWFPLEQRTFALDQFYVGMYANNAGVGTLRVAYRFRTVSQQVWQTQRLQDCCAMQCSGANYSPPA